MGHISAFRWESLTEARMRYAKFLGDSVNEADEQRFTCTSLGIEGWACASVLDDADLAGSDRRGDPSCWSFGGRRICGDNPGSDRRGDTSCCAFGGWSPEENDEHNAQVARLMGALGENGAGRRAILKAVAGHRGITDEDDLKRLQYFPESRRSSSRLQDMCVEQ